MITLKEIESFHEVLIDKFSGPKRLGTREHLVVYDSTHVSEYYYGALSNSVKILII